MTVSRNAKYVEDAATQTAKRIEDLLVGADQKTLETLEDTLENGHSKSLTCTSKQGSNAAYVTELKGAELKNRLAMEEAYRRQKQPMRPRPCSCPMR